MKLEQVAQAINDHVPHGVLQFINWTAFASALGWIFTTVVPAIVGVLSGTWLAMQIYIAWKTKPWRRK